MRTLLVLLASVFLSAGFAVAHPNHTNTANTLRATGIGKPSRGKSPVIARLMARRAAEVVAVRNLARKLRAPTADRRTTTHLSATISGFRYLPPVYRPDGTVEVTVVMLPRRPASP